MTPRLIHDMQDVKAAQRADPPARWPGKEECAPRPKDQRLTETKVRAILGGPSLDAGLTVCGSRQIAQDQLKSAPAGKVWAKVCAVTETRQLAFAH